MGAALEHRARARGDWQGLSEAGREVERIVQENPATTFCAFSVNVLALAAFADALARRPEDVQTKYQLMQRIVVKRARPAPDAFVLALFGRTAEALEALRILRGLGPHETTLTPASRAMHDVTVHVMLERWDELAEPLAQLRQHAQESPYVAATVAAVEEELAAARGGPPPRHAALRSLGYAGRSELLRFRPLSR